VTSPAPALPPSDSAEPLPGAVSEAALAVAGVLWAEMKKLRRDPTDIFTRAVQPLLWLLVFGQVFGRLRAMPTGNIAYLDFLAPGILAQSVLFTSIFYGIAIIWERDLGILHKMLVSPAPRAALVLGKALGASVRASVQAIIIFAVSFVLGVHLRPDPIALLGVLLAIMLGAALFSTFSLTVACIVKTRERFMGIGQVLTMPMFFASSAIYPLDVMPPWLRAIAHVNPLTYLVDVLRTLMIENGTSANGLGVDAIALVVGFIALVAIAAKLYPTVIR
jgi:ABC-2 type transport system permease protein